MTGVRPCPTCGLGATLLPGSRRPHCACAGCIWIRCGGCNTVIGPAGQFILPTRRTDLVRRVWPPHP